MNSFQGSIACSILKAFAGIVQALPIDAALFIGRRIGDVAYWMSVKNRRKTFGNVKIAFGHSKAPQEIGRIVRDFYHAYGQNIVELARLPLLPRHGIGRYIDIDGRQYVDEAMKRGKGLIFLSIHSGNWELSNMVGSLSGYPYSMVANYLGNINKVADYLDSLRMSAGCKIINPGLGGREIIRRLKQNEIVTLVADQGGREGMKTPFFGPEASMSTGAIRLALKYDASICLVDIHRVKGSRHYLTARPFELVRSGDMEKDVSINIERATAWFQERVEEHPCEYIWFYNTWKHSSKVRVVVLDDGRTGHLRQSEALVRHISAGLSEGGRGVYVETARVEYRSNFHAGLLGIISGGRILFPVLGLSFLRLFLTEDSYRSVFSVKPEIVVSCGARNASVNCWLSRESRAKSVTIMRPGFVPYRHFDLVIMPEHDRRSPIIPPNVLVTKAAPNLIDKDYLETNKRALLNRFSHLKMNLRPKLGILIGGDAKGVVMDEQQMRVIFHQIKEMAERYNADILITTSRRTSQVIEKVVAREFGDYKPTALLITASNNVPEAVGGILALADILIVSGESVSMVSEAAASGKKTIVFPIDGAGRKPVLNKYERFVERLGRQGYIIYAQTSSVGQAIDNAFRGKIATKAINDNEQLLKAIKKFII